MRACVRLLYEIIIIIVYYDLRDIRDIRDIRVSITKTASYLQMRRYCFEAGLRH